MDNRELVAACRLTTPFVVGSANLRPSEMVTALLGALSGYMVCSFMVGYVAPERLAERLNSPTSILKFYLAEKPENTFLVALLVGMVLGGSSVLPKTPAFLSGVSFALTLGPAIVASVCAFTLRLSVTDKPSRERLKKLSLNGARLFGWNALGVVSGVYLDLVRAIRLNV